MEQIVFTLGQASIETGKSKPTISRDIKKGKLSARKLPNGSYEIQAVELFRVYGRVTPETVTKKENVTNDNPIKNVNETAMLQQEVKFKNEQIADLKKQLEKEESNTNEWKAELKTMRLLLTNDNTSENKGILGGLKKLLGN